MPANIGTSESGLPLSERLIKMSFQQCNPWPVALQQSRPPLPPLCPSSTRGSRSAKQFPANGNCPQMLLSHFSTHPTTLSPTKAASEPDERPVSGQSGLSPVIRPACAAHPNRHQNHLAPHSVLRQFIKRRRGLTTLSPK